MATTLSEAKVYRIRELRNAMNQVAGMLYEDGRQGHEKAGRILEGVVSLLNEALDGTMHGDIGEMGEVGAVISAVERNLKIQIKQEAR